MVSSTSLSPLLSLPAELRLRIYGFVGPKTQSCHFAGLLLACKILHDEVAHELSKAIAKCVEAIADAITFDGDEILYTAPTTLHGWLNLTVSRPKRANMFHKKDPYLRFKFLFLNTFTITFHNHAEGFEFRPDRPDTYQAAARRLAMEIGMCYKTDWFPAMKRWNLDWSAYPQKDVKMIMRGPLFKHEWDAWEMEILKNDEELLTGVSFHKIPRVTKNTSQESREKVTKAPEAESSNMATRIWKRWNPAQV